jgi:hypothetical protein
VSECSGDNDVADEINEGAPSLSARLVEDDVGTTTLGGMECACVNAGIDTNGVRPTS